MDCDRQPPRLLLLLHQQLAAWAAGSQLHYRDAITWSVISIIGLLGGTGLILYFFGRYDWLGWRETEEQSVRFRPVEQVGVTPAQRAIVWFLFVSSLLFVLQTLTGGLIAHYRAEPESFFGFDISSILPFNIMRTWHVQLAIFWVSASYLATGSSSCR